MSVSFAFPRSLVAALGVGVRCALRVSLPLAPCALITPAVHGQALDLYDTSILRTINIQFHDANWWSLLQQNYESQTNILADLTMDGVTYPDVGVRIRGNTSYTALPAGSQKVSLNIDMDYVDGGQDLLGYTSLNLNNGFRDPTFCREVVYNNFVAQFMPNIRANHVVVTLNGENWGVYNNVQQYNKDMLRDYFDDEDGLRIKCANNPNGPGLRYVGASQSSYTAYEVKDDGGLADPYGALIGVCNAVTNGSTTNWVAIDEVFAIDPSTWSVMLENFLTDDDSYANKGCDFMIYRDPADGRTHLHQTDANETFTQTTWAPTRDFTAVSKPVLSHVLSVPELRQRYMAHYRYAMSKATWAQLEPLFTQQKNLIAAAVQADPKKLYSYTLFQNNFTATVTLPYAGLAGGSIIGIQPFVTQRLAFLNGQAELAAQGPTINSVNASDEEPSPSVPVWITADVDAASGAGIAAVELFYRGEPGVYARTTMVDDGLHQDGGAGDGIFGVQLPIAATAGQSVQYYVQAKSTNSYGSLSFSPPLAENGPHSLAYAFTGAGIRVTEYMYSGTSGEFVELTNTSGAPIDLTGWSFDDDSATPGVVSLSSIGVLLPGESLIITDVAASTFSTAWGIATSRIIGLNTAANLGRNDQINVFDASGNLVERLSYGDEAFPGTIRTQNKSGYTCAESLGTDAIPTWELAAVGDAYGSWAATTGELGSPGTYTEVSCFGDCPSDLSGDNAVGADDLALLLGNWSGSGLGDLDGDGSVGGSDLATLLGAWGVCPE